MRCKRKMNDHSTNFKSKNERGADQRMSISASVCDLGIPRSTVDGGGPCAHGSLIPHGPHREMEGCLLGTHLLSKDAWPHGKSLRAKLEA